MQACLRWLKPPDPSLSVGEVDLEKCLHNIIKWPLFFPRTNCHDSLFLCQSLSENYWWSFYFYFFLVWTSRSFLLKTVTMLCGLCAVLSHMFCSFCNFLLCTISSRLSTAVPSTEVTFFSLILIYLFTLQNRHGPPLHPETAWREEKAFYQEVKETPQSSLDTSFTSDRRTDVCSLVRWSKPTFGKSRWNEWMQFVYWLI